MQRVRAAFAIAVTALAAACSRGARPAQQSAADLEPVLTAARIFYDNGGGIQDSMRVAVRDQASLERFWKQATSAQSSPAAVPAIDFRREMVLLVGAGRKTPEDQIRVDSIGVRKAPDGTGKRVDVLAAIVRTIEGCRRFRADAYPVEMVRVKRFDGQVVFDERREQASDCR